jgi:hypothetical protein
VLKIGVSTSPQKISEDNAIEEIVSVVQKSKQGEAPFIVIVGAGFSHPLVETTHGFVHKNLPTLDDSFVSEPFQWKPCIEILELFKKDSQIAPAV